ncbi:MAG TPA: hypothetical protein VFI46_05115 [Jiangellaceae bacterium]|nr:hypothetical protein [Jiangellaceae bacterium]
MTRKPRLVAAIAVLVLLPVLTAATAQDRAVFERETHFRCYIVSKQTPEPAKTVTVSDQFIPDATVTVDEPLQFCAPTSKDGAEILEPEEHLTMYAANQELTPHLTVFTEDQFGARTLEVVGARVLLVPTQKLVGDLEFPTRLNHYRCYEANGERPGVSVTLEDQFGGPDTVRVEEPVLFCNPVEKIHAGERFRIQERRVHLTCYDIHAPQRTTATQVGVTNQLETDTFTVTSFELLCVPSEKHGFQPAS